MLCGEHFDSIELMYMKGMIEYGLIYVTNQRIFLQVYVDSDWAGNARDMKNTLGWCFSLGYGMISWFNKKQMSVALNTIKAEYIASCLKSCEAVWIQKLLA